MVRFSNCLVKTKKTYKKLKEPVSYALTVTTGLDWYLDPSSSPNPRLRNYLWCLQRLMQEHGAKYMFYMELYDKKMAPTKVHFHGVVDKVTPEMRKQLMAEFGFIQMKPLKDPEVWQIYCEKQESHVVRVIQDLPMISNDRVIERIQNKYERIAEMLVAGTYTIDEIAEVWFEV